ncbi:Copper homeostasis protein cutC-like protein, partial [Armadillidium nasatum]
ICVDSIESAVNAAAGGADRIELCSALCIGGLTPTTALLCEVKQEVDLPVFCMIRPREGPSIYSNKEKELMIAEAKALKECGANGFVFGALLEDGSIDKQFCQLLIK